MLLSAGASYGEFVAFWTTWQPDFPPRRGRQRFEVRRDGLRYLP
jgi:hypothetical protein